MVILCLDFTYSPCCGGLLPKEALEALAQSYDEVLAKYALPAAQDGPGNQKESKPALIAEVAHSTSKETEGRA